MTKLKTWLIAHPGHAPRVVRLPLHPCDVPAPAPIELPDGGKVEQASEFAGLKREHVIDVAAEPEHPAWLRYRGSMSDATYNKLKARGRVRTVAGRVELIEPAKPAKAKAKPKK